MGVAISTTDLFPELTGLRLQQEWRHSYGDPAPPSEAVVPLRQVIGGNMRRAVLLLHLAEAAGVNLIADDMGQSTNDDWVPQSGRFTDALDHICALDRNPIHLSDTEGSFWRKHG